MPTLPLESALRKLRAAEEAVEELRRAARDLHWSVRALTDSPKDGQVEGLLDAVRSVLEASGHEDTARFLRCLGLASALQERDRERVREEHEQALEETHAAAVHAYQEQLVEACLDALDKADATTNPQSLVEGILERMDADGVPERETDL